MKTRIRAPHLAFATKITRDWSKGLGDNGERDTTNRKPYRTREQRFVARREAVLKDGRYVSNAPVSYN